MHATGRTRLERPASPMRGSINDNRKRHNLLPFPSDTRSTRSKVLLRRGRRSTRASGAVAWPRSRSPKGRRGGAARTVNLNSHRLRADHDRQPEDTKINAVRGDVTSLQPSQVSRSSHPPLGRRIIARTRGGRHADLPAPPPPGAHEVTAATALTSRSAPGTASPATRAATTGGARPSGAV